MNLSFLEHLLIFYARYFPIRRGKLRIIDLLWHAGLGGRGTQRLAGLKFGEFKISCDISEMLQRQFYFFGTYFVEEQILKCWKDFATRADVVFDVGANAGIYSLAALAARPSLIVHAFEPTPEIATGLCATGKLNRLDNLLVHELAIYRDTGYASLKRLRGELGSNGGMNFITVSMDEADLERVRTISLDHFCHDWQVDRIDLLKLDIQGHEHSALYGGQRLIEAGRIGTIFMELNWATSVRDICPASECINLLDQSGYVFAKPAKRLIWRTAGDWLRTLSDVVAVQRRKGDV